MANPDNKRGFVPISHLAGRDIVTRPYTIASNYSTPIGLGDPVELTGAGRNIQLAAATNGDNIGVFAGVHYRNARGEVKFSPYWTGEANATDIVALVWDDPDILFEIQCDNLAQADEGVLADWNAGSLSTTFGRSGAYLVTSTSTATSGKAIRVIRRIPRPDNAYGAFCKAEVMFAAHALARVVSGVGGI